jgi:NAD(P)-dependent dehydrogenase (short-subunit alcohol dehydrogenase family)
MAMDPLQEKGSTVLVTGGTGGLGRASAAGRNAEKLESLSKLVRERKLPLEPLELDVSDAASGERAISDIERRAGPVDILVNNAGIAMGAVMEEITSADLHKVFETNFFNPIRLAQRVLPEMRRRRRGRIINMSSISGKVAIPVMGSYASSKHGLEAASDAMRLELYPFGIHVVLIEPGYIHTGMNRTASELSSAYTEGAGRSPYGGIYQGFLGEWEKTRRTSGYQPEDCARVVLRAVEDQPPKARYVVTRRAKIGIFAKRLLSDRALDNQFKKKFRLEEFRQSLASEAEK